MCFHLAQVDLSNAPKVHVVHSHVTAILNAIFSGNRTSPTLRRTSILPIYPARTSDNGKPSSMWWSIIGLGGSSFISSIDKKTVLKGYQVWEDGKCRAMCQHVSEDELAREAFVYKHLGENPHVLYCYGLEEVHQGVHSLRLEYAPFGDVREFIQQHKEAPLSMTIRMRMALDTALGLEHVHSRRVRHCDLSCRNLFLFHDYRVKVGDFGGSLIEGFDELRSSVCEEAAYELPLRGREFWGRPTQKRDLFALGSAIYEIMAWAPPYVDLRDDEIEEMYAAEKFPALEGIPAHDVIQKCWDEKYESVDEVVEALQVLVSSQRAFGRHDGKRVALM